MPELPEVETTARVRLPALALRKDVTFILGPVENLGGQASHGQRADAYRPLAGAAKRAKHHKNKACEHRRDDADDRP